MPAMMANRQHLARFTSDQLHRTLGSAAIITFTGTGLGFIAQIILSRSLGIDGYGVYAFAYAWVMFLGTMAPLGFTKTCLRLVPAYATQDRHELMRGLLRTAQLVALIAGGIGAGLVILIALLSRNVESLWLLTFAIMSMALPVWALVQVRAHILRGWGEVRAALIALSVTLHASVIGGLLLLHALDIAVSPPLAAGVLVAATLVNLAVMHRNYLHHRPAAIFQQPAGFDMAAWRRLASILFVTGLGQQLVTQIALLLVGFFAGSEDVARFAAAHRIAMLVGMPLSIAVTVIGPELSRCFAAGDHDGLRRTYVRTARLVQGAVALAALVVAMAAVPILSLFGDGFPDAAPLLWILLLGQWLQASLGPAGALLTMTRYEVPLLWSTYCSAVIGTGVVILLILVWGVVGAAVGAAAMAVLHKALYALFAYRNLGIHSLSRFIG